MSITRPIKSVLGIASRGALRYHAATISTSYSKAITHQVRASSFLNDNSIPSRNHKPQTTARESWFAKRRRQRNARSKISTLALDPQMMDITAEQPLAQESEALRRSENRENSDQNQTNTRLNPRMKRLLLFCTIISMPIWGQDILEAVIPGVLGVVIFVASNIKKGINWVKSPFGGSRSAS